MILHSFVNIFAGGRSDTKVFLFIAYLVVLLLFYKLVKNYKFIKNLKWKWFGYSLGGLYLYGLFLHIVYIKILGLKITDFVITGNNGEISSSTLSHTHVAKGFVGIILSGFGYSDLSKIDAGGAYISLLPNILFYIGSIVLIFVLIQALCYFVSFFYQKILNKNVRQKLFLIAGYIIISFSIIKTSIDGGLFNYGFLVGCLFVWLYILREKGKFTMARYYIVATLSLLFIIISLCINNVDPGLGLLLASISSLSLLYEIILYASEEKIRLQFLIPIIILFFGSWWQTSVRDRSIYDYGQIVVEPTSYFYTYDKDKKEVVKNTIKNNLSIHDLIEKMNENESYLPITSPGLTCMEKSSAQELSMSLLTREQIKNTIVGQKDFISFNKRNSTQNGKYWVTDFNVSMNPCLPEPLSVIDGMIRKSGIKTYMIIKPIFYDESNIF